MVLGTGVAFTSFLCVLLKEFFRALEFPHFLLLLLTIQFPMEPIYTFLPPPQNYTFQRRLPQIACFKPCKQWSDLPEHFFVSFGIFTHRMEVSLWRSYRAIWDMLLGPFFSFMCSFSWTILVHDKGCDKNVKDCLLGFAVLLF